MVAGIFGQAIPLDPCVFQSIVLDRMREDVVHALAGILGGERAGVAGLVGFERVTGIEVAGGEHFLDGAAGNVAAILTPLFTRAGFAFFHVQQLSRRVGIEVAQEKVRAARPAVRLENFQCVLDFFLANHFILLARVGMKMQNAEGKLFAAAGANLRFQQTIRLLAQGGVIDRVNDRHSAEQRNRMALPVRDDQIHFQSPRDPFKHVAVVGLNQRHHIGALRLDHFRQRIGPAFAAVEDVVREDSQRPHLSQTHLFNVIYQPGTSYWDVGIAISDNRKPRPDVKLTRSRQSVTPTAAEVTMQRAAIGQVLSRMGKLSSIDIDEILEQQAVSHQRFGEIAVSWGLCEPVDLCEAWCVQFSEGVEAVALTNSEVDARLILSLPGELARQLQIVPLVSIADQMVVAAAQPVDGDQWMAILEATGMDVRFVLAEPQAIEAALDVYYPKAA